TDDWMVLLDLLEARLAGTEDLARRTRLLMEAAEIAEKRAGDPVAALRHVSAALALSPGDGWVLSELVRLAEGTAAWAVAADALDAALATLGDSAPERAAQLGFLLGQIRDERLADREKAVSAYEGALRAAPD